MAEQSDRPLDGLSRRLAPLHVDMTIAEAARMIAEAGCGLPVIDDAGKLVGYLGERALLGAITPGYLRELHDTEFFTRDLTTLGRWVTKAAGSFVRDHMAPASGVVHLDDSETHAAELFLHGSVRALPVLDDTGRVVGVLRLGDLIADLMRRSGEAPNAP